MRLVAQSAAFTPPTPDHPNRMRFSGILTRVGVASDEAPNGSHGKRVLLTQAAAERALPSLIGMGVNLSATWDGHSPKDKIGVIDTAWLDGDAVRITGSIWACDFPQHAGRIRAMQDHLGFSFEAQQISVQDPNADPLMITACTFVGAALMAKDAAAYRSTALSIMAGREREGLSVSEGLRMAASSETGFIMASADQPWGVTRRLAQIMASRNVTAPGDVDRLTETQLAKILEDRTPSERIELKSKIAAGGLWPRTLPSVQPVRMPW